MIVGVASKRKWRLRQVIRYSDEEEMGDWTWRNGGKVNIWSYLPASATCLNLSQIDFAIFITFA